MFAFQMVYHPLQEFSLHSWNQYYLLWKKGTPSYELLGSLLLGGDTFQKINWWNPSKPNLKIRQIAKILDTFEAALPAIIFGCLNIFYLRKCENEALKLNKGNHKGLINLIENGISELKWWQKGVDSVNDIYLLLP